MRVVFLDFDGVLNSAKFIRDSALMRMDIPFEGNEHLMLDPKAVALVNEICSRSGAKVVVSSSWRTVIDCPTVLGRIGFTAEIVGVTPHGADGIRGKEIQSWIDEHPEVESFVILDDERDMAHLMPHLVHTSGWLGIQEKHVEEAVRLLELPTVA